MSGSRKDPRKPEISKRMSAASVAGRLEIDFFVPQTWTVPALSKKPCKMEVRLSRHG